MHLLVSIGGGVLEAFLQLVHLIEGFAGADADAADGILRYPGGNAGIFFDEPVETL